MTDDMMQANQVPLVERLRSVPANAHLAVNTPNSLGYDTQHFAIGEMCHRAAALLDAMRATLFQTQVKLAKAQDILAEHGILEHDENQRQNFFCGKD